MGLFGFLATLFSGGIVLGSNAIEASHTADNRQKAKQNGEPWYVDGRGNTYLTSTDEKVYVTNGTAYSLKHHGVILYDGYAEENKKIIARESAAGKKYALLYRRDENSRCGSVWERTELSTMKKYEVSLITYYNKEIGDWDFSFYKNYLDRENHRIGESIKITREEFEELGGFIPHNMTARQYNDMENKKEEERLKELQRDIKRMQRRANR